MNCRRCTYLGAYQIADDIIKGKYKHFEDLRRASNESDDESIAVLYETFESKNGKTYLINSFYINQQSDYWSINDANFIWYILLKSI